MAVHDGSVILVGTFQYMSSFGGDVFTAPGEQTFTTDMFVVKLASDGSHVWSRQFGGPEPEEVGAVAVDPSGNIYVTGAITDTVDFGGGPIVTGDQYSVDTSTGGDLFLLKLSPDGQHLFSAAWGGDSINAPDYGNALVIGSAGEVYVRGSFDDAISFGGDVVTGAPGTGFVARFGATLAHDWTRLMQPGPMARRPSGVLAGSTTVSAIDADGAELWSTSTGVRHVALDGAADGVVCAAGYIQEGSSVPSLDGGAPVLLEYALVLSCYGDGPTPILDKRFATAAYPFPRDVAMHDNGTIWMAASARVNVGSALLSPDGFLAGFTRGGTHVHSESLKVFVLTATSQGLLLGNGAGRVEHRTFE
jgi:hypothetical protein